MNALTIADVRLLACRLWPYASSAITALDPIPTWGIMTIACDTRWRLHYDPQVLVDWTHMKCSVQLLREVVNLLNNAAKRAQASLGQAPSKGDLDKWDAAAALVSGHLMDQSGLMVDKSQLPEAWELKPNGSIEEYWGKLPDQHGGGSGGGSSSNGERRPWEGPQDGSGERPGMGELEGDMVRNMVAQRTVEKSREHGSVPNDMLRWAKELLEPSVDWRAEFRKVISNTLSTMRGRHDYSFRKPRRRQAFGLIMPGMIDRSIRAAIVVDTSGSMSEDDLGYAMTEVRAALGHLGGEGVHVLAADAAIHTCKKVFNASEVKLIGGGGTDMALAIEKAASIKPEPDIIVCITDGYTGWPENPVKPRVLLCLTPNHNRDGLPDWADIVEIKAPNTH